MAAVDFSGSWKLDHAENMEEWLKTLTVNVVKPQEMKGMDAPKTVIQKVTQDGDSFCIEMTVGGSLYKETFTIGQEYTTTLPFGLTIAATANWQGDALVMDGVSKETPERKMQMRRELLGGKMVLTATIEDVSCKRYFVKVDE